MKAGSPSLAITCSRVAPGRTGFVEAASPTYDCTPAEFGAGPGKGMMRQPVRPRALRAMIIRNARAVIATYVTTRDAATSTKRGIALLGLRTRHVGLNGANPARSVAPRPPAR